MFPKNILLVYKKSAYEIYFLNKSSSLFSRLPVLSARDKKRFKKAHLEHYRTVYFIEQVLRKNKLGYKKIARGQKADFSLHDLIVTVGGDGTLLDAARETRTQFILGVNSDPKRSIGRLCSVTRQDFQKNIRKIISGDFRIIKLHRLKLNFSRNIEPVCLLNDLLVCHENPASMSRYRLTINGLMEDQRSSGLWISAAAGSSGAIHSAGGRILTLHSAHVQYMPRELYSHGKEKYHLKGGVVSLKRPIIVKSLMRQGAVYVDGAHLQFPFEFNDTIKIIHSPQPLSVIRI